MIDQADETAARRKSTRVRDFSYHLITFLFMMALFVILDVRAGKGDNAILGLDWAYWLILFWGFAVAGHGIYAFFGDERS